MQVAGFLEVLKRCNRPTCMLDQIRSARLLWNRSGLSSCLEGWSTCRQLLHTELQARGMCPAYALTCTRSRAVTARLTAASVQGVTQTLASAVLTVLPGPADPAASLLQLLPSPGYAAASASSWSGTAGAPASLNITLRDAFGNQQLAGQPGQARLAPA